MKFITPIFCLFLNYLVAQEFSPPNILLINVDDLGWRDVGFMGSKYYEYEVATIVKDNPSL